MKQKSLKSIETKLWKLCREITFARYGNTCYTCGAKNLKKQNLQTGHYYPKGALGAALKYSVLVCRPQCFNCNINFGGRGADFREKMKAEIGVEAEQRLYDDCARSKGYPIKARDHYLNLIEKYTEITKQLST